MSDKDEESKQGESSGTLRDDAAGSSGRPRTKSWGSVIKKSTGDATPSGREESSRNIADALGAHAEMHAKQKEVSQISGLVPLNEFLAPVKEDTEAHVIDGIEMSGFQKRVLDRMRKLRDLRLDIAVDEGRGDADPEVKKIDDELINLKVFLAPEGNDALDGSSVMFDVGEIERRSKSEAPTAPESMGSIGPALEAEGVEIPVSGEVGEEGVDGWGGLDDADKVLDELSGEVEAVPSGLGTGAQEPGGLAETQVWGQGEEQPEENAEKLADGTKTQIRVQVEPVDAEPEETAENGRPVGMGEPRTDAKQTREQTVLGMNAIEEVAEGGDLDNISEISAIVGVPEKDKWNPLSESQIKAMPGGEPKAPRSDPASQRMDTSELKVGNLELASLEGTSIRAPGDRDLTPEEIAKTRLSGVPADPGKTMDIEAFEDFGKYGDIFYAMEKVFIESGAKKEELSEFEEDLEEAITLAEKIASVVETVYDGDLTGISPETRRVQRLRAFRNAFVDVADGESEPKKSLNAYMAWIEAKKAEYKEIGDVFEIMEISPGEYSRRGILRICDIYLESKSLEDRELVKIEKLKGMLEGAQSEEDVDEFAAGREAELMYEMVVGLETKRERHLTQGRKAEIERLMGKDAEMLALKAQLSEKDVKIANYEHRRSEMIGILSRVYAANREEETAFKTYMKQLGKDLVALEPNYKERQKLMGLMFDALAGKGEAGKDLMQNAERLAAEQLNISQVKIDTIKSIRAQETGRREYGPVAKGIGNLITMTAGAALLAGGMWLNQHGINLPFGPSSIQPEKDAAAEVEGGTVEGDTESSLPAGVVEVDAQAEEAGPVEEKDSEGGVIADTGMDLTVKTPEEMEGEVEEVEPAEPVEPPKELTQEEMMAELWKQIDAYSANEHGLLVSGEMLKAAYRSIEKQLDGSVLPKDFEWAKKMLRTKFPNQIYELAVLSDLWRSKSGYVEAGEPWIAYAIGMKLATLLGDAAGRPKFWKRPGTLRG